MPIIPNFEEIIDKEDNSDCSNESDSYKYTPLVNDDVDSSDENECCTNLNENNIDINILKAFMVIPSSQNTNDSDQDSTNSVQPKTKPSHIKSINNKYSNITLPKVKLNNTEQHCESYDEGMYLCALID
ncbi:hypothetical protein A3Q56_01576 [Intoshia linei]|uniref:Uncharacterized protein n=1 Tax=Intoshia linei TaxID=1819745 RepID=A0A177BAV2_9BILA|nr:hypothetical protein A3Q56_01576 [Intoshia linei]